MDGGKIKVSVQGERSKIASPLKKSWYGIKEAGRLWTELLHKTLEK